MIYLTKKFYMEGEIYIDFYAVPSKKSKRWAHVCVSISRELDKSEFKELSGKVNERLKEYLNTRYYDHQNELIENFSLS